MSSLPLYLLTTIIIIGIQDQKFPLFCSVPSVYMLVLLFKSRSPSFNIIITVTGCIIGALFLGRLRSTTWPLPPLPAYTSPYQVGTFDIEVPSANLLPASASSDLIADTVSCQVFYPAEDTKLHSARINTQKFNNSNFTSGFEQSICGTRRFDFPRSACCTNSYSVCFERRQRVCTCTKPRFPTTLNKQFPHRK